MFDQEQLSASKCIQLSLNRTRENCFRELFFCRPDALTCNLYKPQPLNALLRKPVPSSYEHNKIRNLLN